MRRDSGETVIRVSGAVESGEVVEGACRPVLLGAGGRTEPRKMGRGLAAERRAPPGAVV